MFSVAYVLLFDIVVQQSKESTKMKKLLFILLFCFSSSLFAQYSSAAIRLGYSNPEATEGGFIIGYEGGSYIDENFNYGWSIDWFHKEYVDKSLIAQYDQLPGGPSGTINELRAKTNLHEIPLMLSITAGINIAPRFKVILTGAAGVDVLLVFYRNYQNPDDDEFQGAFDFAWRAGGGLSFEIGRRSDLFLELAYHGSKPSWTYEVEINGVNSTFEREHDMSGLLARVGFRFYY